MEFADMLCYLIFVLLSLAVLWDLLLPGYVLTLDSVWSHNLNKRLFDFLTGFEEDQGGIFLSPIPLPNLGFYLFVSVFNLFLPVHVIEKIVWFFILFLCGAGAYTVCPGNRYGKLFAGILYTVNPFTYVRFLAGHLWLLVSYACLPFFIKYAAEFFETLEKKSAIKLMLIMTACMMTAHFLPVVLGIFLVFFTLKFFRTEKKTELLKKSLVVIAGFLALNYYWIFPLAGENAIISRIKLFSSQDIEAFASRPALDFNTLFNVASMHGFWRGGYDYAKLHLPFWYALFLLILYLSVCGFLVAREGENRLYAYGLAVAAVISLIFAAGVNFPPFADFVRWLYGNFFFLNGLREPHKLVAVLAFAYAYFGGIGLADYAAQLRLKLRIRDVCLLAFVVFCLLTPLVYSYTMLFGFGGWLRTVDYPRDWYEVNEFLNGDNEDFNVLFLPWHLYMDFKWIKNRDLRIANPARSFFDKPIIAGDNIEVDGIYSHSTNPVSRYVEFLIANGERIDNFGELISVINVKYVLLTKEADWRNYLWLRNQKDLELVMETENFLVFKNRHEVRKIYQVDGVNTIKDWNELLNVSKHVDITDAVYLLGNATEINDSAGEEVNYTEISPISYVINEKPEKKYLIFAAKYSKFWELGGNAPMKNLGVTNAFPSKKGEIKYSRFPLYLFSYSVSLLTLMLLWWWYRDADWRKFFKRGKTFIR